MQENEWLSYWQQNEGSGEVFVDHKGNKNQQLTQHWLQVFSKFYAHESILDVACGAGSIFRGIKNKRFDNLCALDVSSDALTKLKSSVPHVKTFTGEFGAHATNIGAVKHLVSQFGIEYGGVEAFESCLAYLSDPCTIHTISHIKEGFIDSKNRLELEGVRLLKDTQFLDRALSCIHAMERGEVQDIQQSVGQFTQVEPKVYSFAQSNTESFAAYVYRSVKQVITRLKYQEKTKVLAWFDDIMSQRDELLNRLSVMTSIAMAEGDITALQGLLKKHGFATVTAVPFYLNHLERPIAWNIFAERR